MFNLPPEVGPGPKQPLPPPATIVPMPRKNLAAYKEKLVLNQRQKDISIGVMLGDASLQTQNQGKSYRLKFQVSENHKDYALHLMDEFGAWVLCEPHIFQRKNKNGNTVNYVSFQTLSHEKLKFLADLFIVNRDGKQMKGISPRLVQEHLTPIGLAHWFMDDGGKMDYTSNQGKGLHFHTQGFTQFEVESLVEGLQQKFQLDCWVAKNKNKPIIAVSGKSFERFTELTEKHIIPSMRYKLPTERKKLR